MVVYKKGAADRKECKQLALKEEQKERIRIETKNQTNVEESSNLQLQRGVRCHGTIACCKLYEKTVSVS